MKIRNSFVTNSSSSSFVITNKTDEQKSVNDFIIEVIHALVDMPSDEEFSYMVISEIDLMKLERNLHTDVKINSGESIFFEFGNEDGTYVGNIFECILRDGIETKSFRCRYHESHH